MFRKFIKRLSDALPWNKPYISPERRAEIKARIYGVGVPGKVGDDGKIHIEIIRDGDSDDSS
ncbi:MAG: hypothetical protein O2857_24945 [Planctomycetota bacterium]|nr:hypothetical protein [Planctomycetota bacterium]